jgi:glutathione synthase/RimK-type ligase-like ATP-grasp enzyme
MKNEVLIIGRNFHPDGKETAALIADALAPYLEKQGANVQLALLKDLLFDISNEEIRIIHVPTGRDLKEFGVVLMTNWFSHASIRKDMALTLALYFDQHGITCFNTESLHTRSTSKLSQMMIAAQAKTPIARTVFSLNLSHMETYLRDQNWEGAFILKDAQASRGKGNYLLKGIDEVAGHAAEHTEDHPFIAQTLIKSDGSDYRFFVTGGKVRVVIRRKGSEGSHLNNTSAGATTEIVPVETFSDETIQVVETMSAKLRREVTGIDIMFDTDDQRPYFLEANPIPQIATGSNVELKLQALSDALTEALKGVTS